MRRKDDTPSSEEKGVGLLMGFVEDIADKLL
jgi:hypothetical protein